MATKWGPLIIQESNQRKKLSRKHLNETYYTNGHYVGADADDERAYAGKIIIRQKETRRIKSAVARMTKRDSRLDGIVSIERQGPQDGGSIRTNSAKSRLSAKSDHSIRKASYDWMTAWKQMIDQSEMVDDFQNLSVQPDTRQTSFKSSKEFLTVLGHFYKPRDSRSAPAQPQRPLLNPIASQLFGKVKAIRALGRLQHMKRDKTEPLPAILDTNRENAHRRWSLLRSHVRELVAKKRLRKVTLNWAMLRHVVKGMTNMERSRQDLYMRYGLVPIVMEDGKVIKRNIMLSNRHQAAKVTVCRTSKGHPRTQCRETQTYKKILQLPPK